MAPLPPSNTARYKFHYTITSYSHTTQLRTNVSPAVAGLVFSNIVTALTAECYLSVLDYVEFAANGSNIFNIVTTGYEAMTWGTGAPLPTQVGDYYDFIGRSTGGRRTRVTIFGAKNKGINFRFTAGENASIDAAIAQLVASSANLYAIDGLSAVWKTYANGGTNAHWQKEVR